LFEPPSLLVDRYFDRRLSDAQRTLVFMLLCSCGHPTKPHGGGSFRHDCQGLMSVAANFLVTENVGS
jgi:hypothetical protein